MKWGVIILGLSTIALHAMEASVSFEELYALLDEQELDELIAHIDESAQKVAIEIEENNPWMKEVREKAAELFKNSEINMSDDDSRAFRNQMECLIWFVIHKNGSIVSYSHQDVQGLFQVLTFTEKHGYIQKADEHEEEPKRLVPRKRYFRKKKGEDPWISLEELQTSASSLPSFLEGSEDRDLSSASSPSIDEEDDFSDDGHEKESGAKEGSPYKPVEIKNKYMRWMARVIPGCLAMIIAIKRIRSSNHIRRAHGRPTLFEEGWVRVKRFGSAIRRVVSHK